MSASPSSRHRIRLPVDSTTMILISHADRVGYISFGCDRPDGRVERELPEESPGSGGQTAR